MLNLNLDFNKINKQYFSDHKYLLINVSLTLIIIIEGLLFLHIKTKSKNIYLRDYTTPTGILPPPSPAPSATFLPLSGLSNKNDPFHILLLGIDRRYAQQENFRTDVTMVLSLSSDRKTLLMTSIPRDLWMDTAKINAFYNIGGVPALKEAVLKVTGFTISRYIMVDFDAAVWFVEALGGVDVPVERTFTDYNYPNDREGNINAITVTFEQGIQNMDGETALVYARSRYGNNGEGSDFMRMRRQQNFLKATPAAFFSPQNLFNPSVMEEFYKLITQHIKTDLSLKDTEILYNLLKDYKQGRVEQLVLDHEYLYTPPASDYGGAYVLRPNNEDFTLIHELLESKIN